MAMADSATIEFTPETYPPFPADLPVAELETFCADDFLRNSLPSNKHGLQSSKQRLSEACRQKGCFYVDLRDGFTGIALAQKAQDLMRTLEPIFKLSAEEKNKYLPSDPIALVGYKKVGASVVDEEDTPDNAEFFNVCSHGLFFTQCGTILTLCWCRSPKTILVNIKKPTFHRLKHMIWTGQP
jgi:hypothetical protein